MLEQADANITVNLSEGSFSISGSSSFVEQNREKVFRFVEENIKVNLPQELETTISVPDDPIITDKQKQNNIAEKYDDNKYVKSGIYSVDDEDGKISIHRKVPGNNNADKMKNIAFIVLYQRKEKIMGSEIKELCEKQGCFDASNFSSIFDRDIKNFIKKKIDGRRWSLQLTIDGEAAAVELLEEMLSETK